MAAHNRQTLDPGVDCAPIREMIGSAAQSLKCFAGIFRNAKSEVK